LHIVIRVKSTRIRFRGGKKEKVEYMYTIGNMYIYLLNATCTGST